MKHETTAITNQAGGNIALHMYLYRYMGYGDYILHSCKWFQTLQALDNNLCICFVNSGK